MKTTNTLLKTHFKPELEHLLSFRCENLTNSLHPGLKQVLTFPLPPKNEILCPRADVITTMVSAIDRLQKQVRDKYYHNKERTMLFTINSLKKKDDDMKVSITFYYQ